MDDAHILVIDMNEHCESSSYTLSVDAYMSDALDDEEGPDALAFLQQLAAEDSVTQIDSDRIREYRVMFGFEQALGTWISNPKNMAMVEEQRY